jgi:methylated-DNA-[protein]-cysteine S-methyltransferase
MVWTEQGLLSRIYLPGSKQHITRQIKLAFPCHRMIRARGRSRVGKQITRYFQGKKVRFPFSIVDRSCLYPFQEKVLLTELEIPYGKVSSYGTIAGKIGCSGAARAVGTALARNPFPIIIPCHRAIKADGSIGGFQGGTAMKRRLLQLEGIITNKNGKVVSDCIVY